MNSIKKLFAVLLICLNINFIYAQTIVVLDKSDLQPISNVSVFNKDKSITLVTNSKGLVNLNSFSQTDTIYFQHVAFQTIRATKSSIEQADDKVYLIDKDIVLDDIVFSVNKTDEYKSNVPNKIEIIGARKIFFQNPQTSADVLIQTGNVFVQQSQMGGGSPILRGCESNRVLMVVDGVRMNNAIYRSGHLQNVITIDPNILERVEVSFGPSSVIYGSDAIGGVMYFHTKKPELAYSSKKNIKTNFFSRYSSANDEVALNFSINLGFSKIAYLGSISVKRLGDLRAGDNYSFFGDAINFGKCYRYVERINNTDVIQENTKPNVQRFTGYSQYDIFHKFLYQHSVNSKYILNLQLSNSTDIPRYDRLQQFSGSKPKYAEWYYGPQTRLLISLVAEYKNHSFYDIATITGAYQFIKEERNQRNFGKNNLDTRREKVNVYSMNIDFMKAFSSKSELRYGIESVVNAVKSVAFATDITTDVTSNTISTRYPDNFNTMLNEAFYLTHTWKISSKLNFLQGVRFNLVYLNSEYSDMMMNLMKFPFDKKIKQYNSAINGNLGLLYSPTKEWRIALNGTSGFRAPNVDDIAKINDSKGSDKLIIVPNPDLKPEFSYNVDFTIGKTFADWLNIEFTGFYNLLTNAIVVRSTLFNGQSEISYDGQLCKVQAQANANEAYIYGFQGTLIVQITPNISLNSNISYTYGRVKGENVPLDHIPPTFGQTGIKFEFSRIKFEFYTRYSDKKILSDYSPSGEDNIEQAPVGGMPGWYTLNAKSSWSISRNVILQLGIENILDAHYRYFASGVSAPGRNFIAAIKCNF